MDAWPHRPSRVQAGGVRHTVMPLVASPFPLGSLHVPPNPESATAGVPKPFPMRFCPVFRAPNPIPTPPLPRHGPL